VQTVHGPAQHHKARAAQLGGGGKIEAFGGAGNLVMLFRGKGKMARGANAADLDIVAFNGAVGDTMTITDSGSSKPLR